MLSIIIPAYNEEKILPSTLTQAFKCVNACKIECEIIVVDNNSNDKTAQIAKKHSAKVVFESVNQIARARNTGAKNADGEFLIFLDADTKITETLINKAVNLMQNNYAGGGALIKFDTHIHWSHQTVMSLWNKFSQTFNIAAGCFIFCTKEAFTETDGFNEKYYASEELHFCIALKKWAQKRKQGVTIITDERIVSSARKLHQFSNLQIWGLLLLCLIFPIFVLSKRMCHSFWYKRK